MASHAIRTSRGGVRWDARWQRRSGTRTSSAGPRASPTCSTSTCTSSTRSPARRRSTACALAGRPVRRPDLTLADRGPQRPDARHRQADRRPGLARPGRGAAHERRRVRRPRSTRSATPSRASSTSSARSSGLTQPGMTVVCGDSHTSTHGAFGALAFGIGTSEVEHVLATQTLLAQAVQDDGDHGRRRAARGRHGQGPDPRASSPRSAPAAARATSSSTAARPSDALSMEARMTVCNMSIEAGARAGHDRPRPDHVRLPRGPPARAAGRRLGRGRRVLAHAASPTTTPTFDKEVVHRRRDPRAVRHLGHQPRPGRPALGHRARRRTTSPTSPSASAAERALEYMGLTAGTPMRDIAGRHRLHRLVHQRPHRGPARGRRRHRAAAQVADGVRMLVVPGSVRVRLAGRGRGPRQGLRGGGRRVAQRGLLDVPRHEPRPARAGRAQRVHLEPQLRGPAGPGWTHPPRLARRSPPPPPCVGRLAAPADLTA